MPLGICYREQNLFFCTLYGVWGDDLNEQFQILEKKFFIFFYFIKFFNVITAP